MLGAALRSELSKLYRQRITWASFGVVVLLAGLITWGSHYRQDQLELDERMLSEFVVAGKTVTALFVAQAALPVAIVVLLPMLVAVVVGATIAGERQLGTLRTMMTRPVGRLTVLAAKLLTSAGFAAALTIVLGLAALGFGQAVFGWGDLVILRGGLTILDAQTGLVRVAQAYGLGCVAMATIALVALMFSAILDNPMTAAGLTVALLLVSAVVGTMPYFENVEPYLISSLITVPTDAFAAEIDWQTLRQSLLYLACYAVGATVVGGAVFARRDITC